MTSQPEVPGASAVILFHDETIDDANGTWSYFTRIKILNQNGRDHYSNISIEYILGTTIVEPNNYPDLRNFCDEVASKDQEQLLVHIKPASTVTPNPAP